MPTKFKLAPRPPSRTHGASRDNYNPNSALWLAIIFAAVSSLVIISMAIAYYLE